MELLEVPQLMDMCVRNAVYDEALDLQSFVTRLGLLHPNVPVVKKLLQQVCPLVAFVWPLPVHDQERNMQCT